VQSGIGKKNLAVGPLDGNSEVPRSHGRFSAIFTSRPHCQKTYRAIAYETSTIPA